MTGTLPPARIGVFGGTFNPIHLGHLRAAEEAAEALGLSRLLFVPSAVPPHKRPQRGDPLAKPLDRLDWVRLATLGNPRFGVDPLEIERDGPSYMVDTLRELGARLAERPVLVIGRDAFAEIDAWRDPVELFRLAHFAVLTRPPERGDDLAAWLPRCVAGEIELDPGGRTGRHRSTGTHVCALDITALDISSSGVRERLREGRSIRYLLPDRVREAVERSGVYGPGAGS